MKKLIYIFAIGTLLASCGGNNPSGKSHEQGSGIEKTDAEVQQSGYKPPFSITAQRLTDGGEKKPLNIELQDDNYYSRLTYVIELYSNGKYKAQKTTETRNRRTGYRWWKDDPVQFEGKWTTSYRELGDDNQKVYELHLQNNSGSLYLPEDCEFLFTNWYDCKNHNENSHDAINIIDVSRETGIIKNIETDTDDGTPGPELWGLSYEGLSEGSNGDFLMKIKFDRNYNSVSIYRKPKEDPNLEWEHLREGSYTYKGKQIVIDCGWKGKITADGSSMTFKDGFGDTYSFNKVE